MPSFALVLTLLVGLVAPSFAAIVDVPAGDVAALVAAIDAANASGEDDTIVLAAGATYSLTAVHNGVTGLPVVTTRILVQGNGATIQRTGAPEFRIFDVAGSGDLTLDRVTVKGGRVTFETSPTFSDGGAGIRVLGAATLTLTGSTVTQNTCAGAVCQGGGILLYDDAFPLATLTDSTISENFAQQGGGVCLRHNDQSIVITRTTFSGNTGIDGGGLATMGADTVTITDSTFSGNSVSDLVPGGALGGGALDVGGGTWTISGTTFTGNSASGSRDGGATNFYGGAMGENGGATITMVNSTITGNSVTNGGTSLAAGGGLFGEGGGTWNLRNVTIAGNTVTAQNGSGGGLEVVSGEVFLRNSIVANNVAAANPDCSDNTPGTFATIGSEGHNVIEDATGCELTPATGDVIGQDPQLGALADNGGPTQTMAIAAGSPALNAGDPGTPGQGTGCEPGDQRGTPRPQDGRCDVGAFELGAGTTTTTTLPGGACVPREPTFVNIDCRLDLLVAAVEAADDLGRLKPGLVGAITKARTKKIQAEQQDAADRAKQAKNALKKAIRKTTSFIHKVRSRSGRKIIPQPTATALVDAANPILADMKALLRTL